MPLVPLVAALGLNGDAQLHPLELEKEHKTYDPTRHILEPMLEVMEPPETIAEPTTQHEQVSDSVKSAIRTILATMGTDLCAGQDSGSVKVVPFQLGLNELNKALNPNSLDAVSWGVKKNISPKDTVLSYKLFSGDQNLGLPFCYSEDGLRAALYDLDLPKTLQNGIHECTERSNPYKAWSQPYHDLESALRKGVMSVPLDICISHCGGDYGPTKATFSGGIATVTPSCFTTVAASAFGYPPNAKEPYAAYLANEKRAVLAESACIADLIQ